MKRVVILGSTGSVGKNACRVAEALHDRVQVVGIAAKSNVGALAEQAGRLGCSHACIGDASLRDALAAALPEGCRALAGPEGLLELARLEQADMIVFCSPLYWYNFSGHIKCAMDRLYPYSKKEKLRDLPIKEAMLLMCGESLFLRSFAGPAESYRQMLGLKGWKDRGRLFVTGVHEFGDMKGHKALTVAEQMGRNA